MVIVDAEYARQQLAGVVVQSRSAENLRAWSNAPTAVRMRERPMPPSPVVGAPRPSHEATTTEGIL